MFSRFRANLNDPLIGIDTIFGSLSMQPVAQSTLRATDIFRLFWFFSATAELLRAPVRCPTVQSTVYTSHFINRKISIISFSNSCGKFRIVGLDTTHERNCNRVSSGFSRAIDRAQECPRGVGVNSTLKQDFQRAVFMKLNQENHKIFERLFLISFRVANEHVYSTCS
ncbi:hypothetical protein PUN28_010488 [Cardiocondyla obscurior]|uniref:Uncharacterized protein n=1 Tax=Cardiocondyla obscurior TaxID=286306 RepID=A0AAW2FIR8_9HYME